MAYRFGIFGGTFDPFTSAHLEIVKQALNIVDGVVIAPTIVSWHRKDKTMLLDAASRMKLIKDVVEAADLGDRVMVFEGDYKKKALLNARATAKLKSKLIDDHHFADTLVDIRLYLDEFCATEDIKDFEVYPIIGSDSYVNLQTWPYWQDVLELSDGLIVVTGRNSEDASEITDEMKLQIPFTELKISPKYLSISASKIREELSSSRTSIAEYTKKLCDEAVPSSNLTLMSTPIFDVISGAREPNGLHPIKIKAPDWVTIIVKKDSKLLVESQHRYGTDSIVEEFPCGMVEENENPKTAALRELAEETGIKVLSDPVKLGCVSPNPAFMMNRMHYFFIDLDNTIYETCSKHLDVHEEIDVKWVDEMTFHEKILEKTKSDDIRTIPPAMLLAAFHLLYKKF